MGSGNSVGRDHSLLFIEGVLMVLEVGSSAWARRLAEETLSSELPARWLHTVGVATKASRFARIAHSGDSDLIVAAAFMHDIGYGNKLVSTGLHALDGARFLQQMGVSKRLCGLVAHHSYACREAELRGLSAELAEWRDEKTLVRDALWWADMTTGPKGNTVSVQERIAEIQARYGPEDLVTVFIRQAEPELVAAVERTEARLRAAGVEVR